MVYQNYPQSPLTAAPAFRLSRLYPAIIMVMATSTMADSRLPERLLPERVCEQALSEKITEACQDANLTTSFLLSTDYAHVDNGPYLLDKNIPSFSFTDGIFGSLLASPTVGLGALVLGGATVASSLVGSKAGSTSSYQIVGTRVVDDGGVLPGEPDTGDPDPGDPEPDEPDTGDPDPGDPEPDEPDTGDPDDPDPDDPDPDDPDTDDPDTGDPDTGDPDTGDPDTGDPDDPDTSDPDSEPVSPEVYRTSEYLTNATAFDMIGLDRALSNISAISSQSGIGQAGEGITIAIIDSGVDINHPSLNDNVVDDCTGNCGTHYGDNDVSGHGSHVAGIAAAEKDESGMHGIAYNATILPGCANFGESCQPSQSPGASELLLWAASNGAHVANMSYGLPHMEGDEEVRAMVATDAVGANPDYNNSALKSGAYLMFGSENSSSYNDAMSAFEQGLVAVVAAGNHKFGANNSVIEIRQAGVHTLAPLIYQNTALSQYLNNQWVAVVNIDNNQTLSTSHACGDAQNFCIAAPGTNILSTLPNGQHGSQTGTSMATPVVSGAVAFVMAAFPSLQLPESDPQADVCNEGSSSYNARQCRSKAAVNRILVTATDIGDPGVDAVFGRGLLNLDAATRLVGQAQIATASGQRFNIEDSQLNLSPAMGQALANVVTNVNVVAFDSYDQAGFIYQGISLLGAGSQQDVKVNTLEYLNRSLKPISNSLIAADGTLTLTQEFQKAYTPHTSPSSNYRLRFTGVDQSQLEITTAFNPESDFVMHAIPEAGFADIAISSAFHSPYSQFNERAKGVKYQLPLGSGYTLESGFFQSKSVKTMTDDPAALDTTSMVMQVNSPIYRDAAGRQFSASFQIGSLAEENSLLGSSGSGVWNFNNGSESLITGLNLNYQISSNTHLLFNYFYSSTDMHQDDGLLQGRNNFTSSSFSLGLLGYLSESLQYGLTVSQPLRLTNGTATLELPTSFSGSALSFDRYNIELAPEGRQLEYEFSLGWKPDVFDYINMNVLRIEDYGNIQGNNDTVFLFSAGSEF